MEVHANADVDELLRLLAGPDTDDAIFLGRGPVPPFMQVAVSGGFVYLTWTDSEFLGSPVGDPQSPATHGGYNPLYFAGTGLAPAAAADTINGWLIAPDQRPGSVRWVDEEVLAAEALAAADTS